jgi:hypothetical protein
MLDEPPSPEGLSTISQLFQRFFSGPSQDRSRERTDRVVGHGGKQHLNLRSAARAAGRKAGRATIPPEGRSHEEEQQLELGGGGAGGGAAPFPVRPMRWLA